MKTRKKQKLICSQQIFPKEAYKRKTRREENKLHTVNMLSNIFLFAPKLDDSSYKLKIVISFA